MNTEQNLQPIIITCKLDNKSAAYFNSCRQQYFPAAKNFLKAHLTLFHRIQLPVTEVLGVVEQVTVTTKPFEMLTERISFTGRGVAFVLKSPHLISLHKTLQLKFKAVLTPQDRQVLWPHITIQNKVPENKSKTLATELQEKFKPFTIMAAGLQLFYYMNGPWEFIADANFG